MKFRLLQPLLTVAFALLALPAFSQTTALVGARVIDGTGQVIDRGTVIVRDGKIVQVGPAASVTVPPGADRVDLAGLDPDPRPDQRARPHRPSRRHAHRRDQRRDARENVLRQLKTYAQYGITTVFSLGR